MVPFDAIPSRTELGLLWPVPHVVGCHRISAVPKAKMTRKLQLRKAVLETHQECHHFDVSDNISTVLFILQGVCIPLRTAVSKMRRDAYMSSL